MLTRFEWDPAKERANRRKHGLSFDTILSVFLDPFVSTTKDRDAEGEERWRTIGCIVGGAIVFVAHTIREERDGSEVIRIISARSATGAERRQYEKQKFGFSRV